MTGMQEAPGGDSQGLDSDSTRHGQAESSFAQRHVVAPMHRPWFSRDGAR